MFVETQPEDVVWRPWNSTSPLLVPGAFLGSIAFINGDVDYAFSFLFNFVGLCLGAFEAPTL